MEMDKIGTNNNELNTEIIPETKRVTLHPLTADGEIDLEVNLYPKTLLDGIVDRDGKHVEVQEKLISGENIKTINGDSILGSGNIETINAYTKEESNEKFATKEELENKADDNSVVHLNGNEIINGEKTFTDSVSFNGDFRISFEGYYKNIHIGYDDADMPALYSPSIVTDAIWASDSSTGIKFYATINKNDNGYGLDIPDTSD